MNHNAASGGALTDERERFEDWCVSQDPPRETEKLDDGRYAAYGTDFRWEVWRAATSGGAPREPSDWRETAARIALEQRWERGTPWDAACVEIAQKLRAYPARQGGEPVQGESAAGPSLKHAHIRERYAYWNGGSTDECYEGFYAGYRFGVFDARAHPAPSAIEPAPDKVRGVVEAADAMRANCAHVIERWGAGAAQLSVARYDAARAALQGEQSTAPKCSDGWACTMPGDCQRVGHCISDAVDCAPAPTEQSPAAGAVAEPTPEMLVAGAAIYSYWAGHPDAQKVVSTIYAAMRKAAPRPEDAARLTDAEPTDEVIRRTLPHVERTHVAGVQRAWVDMDDLRALVDAARQGAGQ